MTAPISFACLCPRKTQVDTRFRGCQSSLFTVVKRRRAKLALAKEQSATRQKLYAEFLVETQRLVVQAREEKLSSLADLNTLNGKFAEVSLFAPDNVLEAAKKLADCALTSHSAQPANEVAAFYLLKEKFITVARQDISNVLNGA